MHGLFIRKSFFAEHLSLLDFFMIPVLKLSYDVLSKNTRDCVQHYSVTQTGRHCTSITFRYIDCDRKFINIKQKRSWACTNI